MLPISNSEDDDGASCVRVRVPARGLPPSLVFRCFGVLTGSIFGLPPHEQRPSAPCSNVSSSLALQTIAPPVVSASLPRWVEGQDLRLCDLGVRSKAAGERPSGSIPKASPAPISSAPITGSPMLRSTLWSEMASMAVPSTSRRSAVRLAAPRSVLDATLPCIV
jgi:hypothetical protein